MESQQIDFKGIAENLIDSFLLQYIQGKNGVQPYADERGLNALASIVYYKSCPINWITKLAKERNETFSFLQDRHIDTNQLKQEIEERVQTFSSN